MSEQDKTWSKHDQTLKEFILRPVALFLAQIHSQIKLEVVQVD